MQHIFVFLYDGHAKVSILFLPKTESSNDIYSCYHIYLYSVDSIEITPLASLVYKKVSFRENTRITIQNLHTWNQAFQIAFYPPSEHIEQKPVKQCECEAVAPVTLLVESDILSCSYIFLYTEQQDPREFTYLRMITGSCQPTIHIGHLSFNLDNLDVTHLKNRLPPNGSFNWKSSIFDLFLKIWSHEALCQANVTFISQVPNLLNLNMFIN